MSESDVFKFPGGFWSIFVYFGAGTRMRQVKCFPPGQNLSRQ